MKLYFMPRTRSIRPRWLLEELEVPYELVKLDASSQEQRAPDYRTVNPFGEVPALVDGEVTLFESLAICLYLADLFPEKRLAPPPGSLERGPYYQWMVFAEGRLDAAVMAFYWHVQLPEAEQAGTQKQAELAAHRARLEQVLEVLNAALDGCECLVGGQFTAADLVTASILHLANHLKLLEAHPRLVAYTYRHCQRPAVRRAMAG
jgi:glutathione S-transferase